MYKFLRLLASLVLTALIVVISVEHGWTKRFITIAAALVRPDQLVSLQSSARHLH